MLLSDFVYDTNDMWMETLLAFFDILSEHSSGDTRKIKEQETSINFFSVWPGFGIGTSNRRKH